MGIPTVLALCLCGQVRFSPDDSINQWESHLLESSWALNDPLSSGPRVLLVIKCLRPDHRIFQLYLYDRWEEGPCATVRAWTGTYKMESREYRENGIAEKIVRLNFEQYWLPVDGFKPNRIRAWMNEQDFVQRARDLTLFHWSEELDLLNWVEERDFKPFLAEMRVDGPKPDEPIPAEYVKFLLRSADVKKVGWWLTGTEYVLEPVRKWCRWPTAIR